ncbi:MAG: tRNA uridine-5-carboxymethylaminomethyl(34) synthesis enzyme MnmG, partial [Gammaproteobacteria bacterium]
KGRELGLVDDNRWRAFSEKREQIEIEQQRLRSSWVQPGSESAAKIVEKTGAALNREYSLHDLLKRPELGYQDVCDLAGVVEIAADVAEQVEIEAKYSGYIDRQQDEIDRLRRQENTPIPADFNYQAVKGLSNEVKQKLTEARPETLARASRIPGVTPAAVSLLLIYLKKKSTAEQKIA